MKLDFLLCFPTALPVEFLTELKPLKVAEKQTAEFVCEISDENAEVTWMRDGQPIEESDKFLIVKRGLERRLSVTNADVPDGATYSCMVGDRRTSADLLVDGECIYILMSVYRDANSPSFCRKIPEKNKIFPGSS